MSGDRRAPPSPDVRGVRFVATKPEPPVWLGGIVGNILTAMAMIGSVVYVFTVSDTKSQRALDEVAGIKQSIDKLPTGEGVDALRAAVRQIDERLTVIDQRLGMQAQQQAAAAVMLDNLQHPPGRSK